MLTDLSAEAVARRGIAGSGWDWDCQERFEPVEGWGRVCRRVRDAGDDDGSVIVLVGASEVRGKIWEV